MGLLWLGNNKKSIENGYGQTYQGDLCFIWACIGRKQEKDSLQFYILLTFLGMVKVKPEAICNLEISDCRHKENQRNWLGMLWPVRPLTCQPCPAKWENNKMGRKRSRVASLQKFKNTKMNLRCVFYGNLFPRQDSSCWLAGVSFLFHSLWSAGRSWTGAEVTIFHLNVCSVCTLRMDFKTDINSIFFMV